MWSIEERIKKRLTEISMNTNKLAALAGIKEPTLYAIFERNDAKLSQLKNISQVLGVPLSFLIEEENNIRNFSGTVADDVSGTYILGEKIMHKSYGQNSAQSNDSSKLVKLSADLVLCTERVKYLESILASKEEIIDNQKEIIDLLKRANNT
jgi:transcriptional regulator with XRE-family HTH domain